MPCWKIPTRARCTSSPPRRWRRTNSPNCTIWRTRLDDRFGVFTYDGDTPSDARKAIRERGHVILTNPDMLHTGILPHHTRWTRLFENLRYIVLDELHTYRGVFGSHLANVLRRLRRVARFYGSEPQFICCSATIANPGELAAQLIESRIRGDRGKRRAGRRKTLRLLQSAGGEPLSRHSAQLHERNLARRARNCWSANCRRSSSPTAGCTPRCCSPICSRRIRPQPGSREPIRGYRGGYLPGERREIERGLREGRIRGVVSTNALELGIDIGSLDAMRHGGICRIDRLHLAARRTRRTPQRNLLRRAGGVLGAARSIHRAASRLFLRPLAGARLRAAGQSRNSGEPSEMRGVRAAARRRRRNSAASILPALCERLAEAGFLHRSGGNWHWVQEAYPADAVSLRAVTSDNFVISIPPAETRRRAGSDRRSRFFIGAHDRASQGDLPASGTAISRRALDFEERKAYVKPVDVDYYTDAIRYTQVRVLEIAEEEQHRADRRRAPMATCWCVRRWSGFKKIKFFTNENVGAGKLELPENEMHTTAFWITLERKLLTALPFSLSDRQSGMFGLLHALESMATLLLMCDRRDLGTAVGERPASPGVETGVAGIHERQRTIRRNEGILRAESVSLRRLSRRHRILRAALSRPRLALAQDARADCRVPLRTGLPIVRRPRREKERARQRSGAGDSGRLCA